MRHEEVIPLARFDLAYAKAGWTRKHTKDGVYAVWQDPNDKDTWMMLPNDENASEYRLYQEKNILMLLYALNIPETGEAINELYSQLKSSNYKLLNRIVVKDDYGKNSVPYELSAVVPEKNIDAFRYFYQTKAKGDKAIPIERFQLSHTEVGRFVIPISIQVDESEQTTLASVQSDTNKVLHDYLSAVETLTKIPRESAEKFAEKVLSESINSKIVKDFFGNDHSIAKFREKYSSQVKEITIGSKGSYILDYGLRPIEKKFDEVNISNVESLSSDFIETLERLEVASDDTSIEENGVKLSVLINSISINGRVQFEVLNIQGISIEHSFKANGSQLTKFQLDVCADYFKERKPATILADVSKRRGRMGTLRIESISAGKMNSNGPTQLELS
ncbi:MAG: hypothetical protein EOO88_36990 [Pedobacter sp.]|nr:MAG: hypothetical protein EOO88_36990 [Pedobacter sp.]